MPRKSHPPAPPENGNRVRVVETSPVAVPPQPFPRLVLRHGSEIVLTPGELRGVSESVKRRLAYQRAQEKR